MLTACPKPAESRTCDLLITNRISEPLSHQATPAISILQHRNPLYHTSNTLLIIENGTPSNNPSMSTSTSTTKRTKSEELPISTKHHAKRSHIQSNNH